MGIEEILKRWQGKDPAGTDYDDFADDVTADWLDSDATDDWDDDSPRD